MSLDPENLKGRQNKCLNPYMLSHANNLLDIVFHRINISNVEGDIGELVWFDKKWIKSCPEESIKDID